MANQTFEDKPQVGPRSGPVHEERALQAVGAGSAAEAIGGAAAVVLAIIGLANGVPVAMMSIATIVLGGAILLDATAVGVRHQRLVRDTWGRDVRAPKVRLGTGLSAEALAGVAGIVLGILALLGDIPVTLGAIAVIVFGGGMMLGTVARRRHDDATNVATGGDVLIGIGAVVLGILALLGLYPLTLVLVALLGVGGAVMFGGSVLGTKALHITHHPAR